MNQTEYNSYSRQLPPTFSTTISHTLHQLLQTTAARLADNKLKTEHISYSKQLPPASLPTKLDTMKNQRYILRSSTVSKRASQNVASRPGLMETNCCSSSTSTKNTKTGHKNLNKAALTSETPRTLKAFDLMRLPTELRLNVLSYVLAEVSDTSGIISINPHARKFVLKGGNIVQDGNPNKQLTQWRARRGILQACHTLREETLELLYNQNTFFASMNGRCALYPMCYERRRFSRWLKVMGGDAEARRIKRMVFAVSWPSTFGRNGWKNRRADVNVCVLRNMVKVELVPLSDKPMAALVDVEELIEEFLQNGVEGKGLNRDEWAEIWDEIADFVCCQYDSSDL